MTDGRCLIYLADLTHTGQLVASNTHPLAIGLIAAYVRAKLGEQVEIELFKYPQDLSAALERRAPRILGIDRHPWALAEAAQTYRDFGLPARTRQGEVSTVTLPAPPVSMLAAFTFNEMPAERRESLLQRLIERAARGDRLLIVEPIARRLTPWWNEWSAQFTRAGGREDTWRFSEALPERLRLLDRAAGLDHHELTGRSLWLPGRSGRMDPPKATQAQ